jgi:hypothetical protein
MDCLHALPLGGRHNQFFDLTVAGLVINAHDSLSMHAPRARAFAYIYRDAYAHCVHVYTAPP